MFLAVDLTMPKWPIYFISCEFNVAYEIPHKYFFLIISKMLLFLFLICGF